MRILIIPVNYNSYKELECYLSSINKAVFRSKDTIVEIIIADNSTIQEPCEFAYNNISSIHIEKYDNLGYLGGAQKVMNSLSFISDYDYIVISNVDILLGENFFMNLSSIKDDDTIGWIAPQIWTEEECRDKNPKVIKRYTRSKLEKIKLLYRYPFLDYVYTNTLYLKKKSRPNYNEMDIYAGHGSFIILTKHFFKFYKEINYPLFLFGEELFLAELNKKAGLKVRYIPALKVIDKEHVSTSKMKKKSYYKYNLDSINYILDTFYE